MKLRALILGVALAAFSSLQAAPVVIDNFTVNLAPDPLNDTTGAGSGSAAQASPGNFVGTRLGFVFKGPQSGAANNSAASLSVGSGNLSFALPSNYFGFGDLFYGGLGGIDLTGGLNSLVLRASADAVGLTPAGRTYVSININGIFAGVDPITHLPTFTGGSTQTIVLNSANITDYVIPWANFGGNELNANQVTILLSGIDPGADANLYGLTSVPEPSTFAAFGGGLLLLGLFARRRRK